LRRLVPPCGAEAAARHGVRGADDDGGPGLARPRPTYAIHAGELQTGVERAGSRGGGAGGPAGGTTEAPERRPDDAGLGDGGVRAGRRLADLGWVRNGVPTANQPAVNADIESLIVEGWRGILWSRCPDPTC